MMDIRVNENGSGEMDGWQFGSVHADAVAALTGNATTDHVPAGTYQVEDDEVERFAVAGGRLEYE